MTPILDFWLVGEGPIEVSVPELEEVVDVPLFEMGGVEVEMDCCVLFVGVVESPTVVVAVALVKL